jgi:hypothetical protein
MVWKMSTGEVGMERRKDIPDIDDRKVRAMKKLTDCEMI